MTETHAWQPPCSFYQQLFGLGSVRVSAAPVTRVVSPTTSSAQYAQFAHRFSDLQRSALGALVLQRLPTVHALLDGYVAQQSAGTRCVPLDEVLAHDLAALLAIHDDAYATPHNAVALLRRLLYDKLLEYDAALQHCTRRERIGAERLWRATLPRAVSQRAEPHAVHGTAAPSATPTCSIAYSERTGTRH